MNKILQNIQSGLGNNILEYCFCGSGIKYNDCCKKQESDFINIFTNFISTINEEDKSLKNRDFYRYLWENMSDNKCIFPGCCNKNIESHLYPKSYLKKNGISFYISFLNKTIHANNITTPLFCKEHDNNLFEISDNIDNFHDLLKNQKALENYFTKILFFKYKTFLIEMRYSLLRIYYGCKDSEKVFYEIYSLYNKICYLIEIFNEGKKIIYPIFPSFNYFIKNNYNTIFSNICFTPLGNPFGIILTKDNGGYNMAICSYGNYNNSDCINILNKINEVRNREIHNNFEDSREIFEFLITYFNLNIYYNRKLFLYNDFIDIGIMIFSFDK